MRDTRLGTAVWLLAMLASAAPEAASQQRHIPKRDFTVHGPWLVAGTALGTPNASDPERARMLPAQPVFANDVRTPRPYAAFVDTAMLGGIDPGIAVGKEFVLLTDNANGIAAYRRDGSLVQRGTFPLVIELAKLFKPATDDANSKIQYPPDLPDEWKGVTRYGDVRVAYDAWRGRFWIYARGGTPRPDAGTFVLATPALRLARRNKAMVAVSRTEDPRDGFITYWWDESYKNGSCLVVSPCGDDDYAISGEGADYPTVAIVPKLFVVTVGVNRHDPGFDVSTLARADDWVGCKTRFVHEGTPSEWCGPFYSHLLLVDASKLAAGCDKVPTPRGDVTKCPTGRSFGVFIDKDNWVTDWADNGRKQFATGMARGVRPVTMYTQHVRLSDTPPFAEAFFVTSYIDRSVSPNRYYLTLYTYMNDELTVSRYPLALKSYRDWEWPMSAVYRDGKIWVAHHDRWPGEHWRTTAIRLSRINLTTQKVDIDRKFGLRSVAEDPAGSTYVYHFPALAITTQNDLVVSYARRPARDTTWREVRYSVWYADEPDLRSSRRLVTGTGLWPRSEFSADLGGISLDPSGTSVWIAHLFSQSGRARRLAFGQFRPRSSGTMPKPAGGTRREMSADLLGPPPIPNKPPR